MFDRLPQAFSRPGLLRWSDVGGAVSGGASLLGEVQTRSISGGGSWMATMTSIPLFDEADMRVWEALMLNWSLGDTRVIVPRAAGRLAAKFVLSGARATHSDGSAFSDGSLYTGGGIGWLAEAVALRATEAKILLPTGAGLLGGEPFTLVGPRYGERLYGVSRIGAIDGQVVTVRFAKPAREAYPEGTEVDFADPRCLMKAQIADGSGWPDVDEGWMSSVNMTFRETADVL